MMSETIAVLKTLKLFQVQSYSPPMFTGISEILRGGEQMADGEKNDRIHLWWDPITIQAWKGSFSLACEQPADA